VQFCDLLRMTTLLAAGSGTALAAVTAIAADRDGDTATLIVAGVWWVLAIGLGIFLGRPARAAEAMRPLLAGARTTPTLPSDDPGRVALARLWPLAAFALLAGIVGFVYPGVAAVGTGFSLAAALVLRTREGAVTAVEQRDGVRFYVEPGSVFHPVTLVRTPGLRRDRALSGHPPPPPTDSRISSASRPGMRAQGAFALASPWRLRSGANERQGRVLAICRAFSQARRAVATAYCMFSSVSTPWASVLQAIITPASAARRAWRSLMSRRLGLPLISIMVPVAAAAPATRSTSTP